MLLQAVALLVAAAQATAPAPHPTPAAPPHPAHSLTVWATAYNAGDDADDDSPVIGAWGDELDPATRPGTRVIAVSRDLLQRGLRRGQRVKIKGLRGDFVVLDKMPPQWKRRIDIYMKQDERAARRWGKRWVKLYWNDSAPE